MSKIGKMKTIHNWYYDVPAGWKAGVAGFGPPAGRAGHVLHGVTAMEARRRGTKAVGGADGFRVRD